MVDLSIIIVTYNVKDLLRRCLESVRDNSGGLNVETFVVDNNSHDGTAEAVRREFPEVRVIESATNGGYAYATTWRCGKC